MSPLKWVNLRSISASVYKFSYSSGNLSIIIISNIAQYIPIRNVNTKKYNNYCDTHMWTLISATHSATPFHLLLCMRYLIADKTRACSSESIHILWSAFGRYPVPRKPPSRTDRSKKSIALLGQGISSWFCSAWDSHNLDRSVRKTIRSTGDPWKTGLILHNVITWPPRQRDSHSSVQLQYSFGNGESSIKCLISWFCTNQRDS